MTPHIEAGTKVTEILNKLRPEIKALKKFVADPEKLKEFNAKLSFYKNQN